MLHLSQHAIASASHEIGCKCEGHATPTSKNDLLKKSEKAVKHKLMSCCRTARILQTLVDFFESMGTPSTHGKPHRLDATCQNAQKDAE